MTNQQPPPDAFSMDCARAQDILFDLQESQMEVGSGIIVSPEDRSRLDQHLANCAHCRSYQQTISNLALSVTELKPAPVPAGLEDRIIARISLEASVSKDALGSGSQWKKYMPLAAAVLVLAIAIPLVMKSMTGSPGGLQVAQYSQGNPELQPGDLNELANLPEQIQPMNMPPEQPMQEEAMHPQEPPIGPGDESVSYSGPMQNPPHSTPEHRSASEPQGAPSQPRGGNYAVDSSSLASALPTTAKQLSETYNTSDEEGDVYYDPVSNLVGF